jgi:hypothetical protein
MVGVVVRLMPLLSMVAYAAPDVCDGYGDPRYAQPATDADATWAAADPDSAFGAAMVNLGDFDGDGADDLAVGAPDEDNGAAWGAGAVYLFLSAGGALEPDAGPTWVLRSPYAQAHAGAALSAAGDVNGDGLADLVVGSNATGSTAGPGTGGYVWVVFGTAATPAEFTLDPGSELELYHPALGADFGYAVAGGGDIDGDGFDDIVVGIPGLDQPGVSDVGGAMVFQGPLAAGSLPSASYDRSHVGAQANERAGRSVTLLGDSDLDGFADYAVGAPEWGTGVASHGRVYVIPGSASPSSPPLTSAPLQVEGANHEQLGWLVTAEDGDLLTAAWDHGGGRGAVYRFPLHGQTWPVAPTTWTASTSWSMYAIGQSAGDHFGEAIAAGFNTNGYAAPDLAIGGRGGDLSDPDAGVVRYLLDGVGGTVSWSSAGQVHGVLPDGRFGASVAAFPDMNGDGFGDLVVGLSGDASLAVFLGGRDTLDLADWYQDVDRDAFGGGGPTLRCDTTRPGVSPIGGDCNDNNRFIHPGQSEVCDDIDNDCDGLIDDSDSDALLSRWYQDADLDGYGNQDLRILSCDQPPGYVVPGTDCDDQHPFRNPGMAEVCNQVDEDCDHDFYIGGTMGLDAADWSIELVQGATSARLVGKAVARLSDTAVGGTARVAFSLLWGATQEYVMVGELPIEVGQHNWAMTGSNPEETAHDLQLLSVPGTGSTFGDALVAADFDLDGWADLAVGAPGEQNNKGRIYVWMGSPIGFATNPDVIITSSTANGRLGAALVAVDADGDEAPELFVGSPGQSAVFRIEAEELAMLPTTIDVATATKWSGIAGSQLGISLAPFRTGVFDWGIAVGAPGSQAVASYVAQIPAGSSGGAVSPWITAPGSNILGAAVTAGDYDGDGIAEVAFYGFEGTYAAPFNARVWMVPFDRGAGVLDTAWERSLLLPPVGSSSVRPVVLYSTLKINADPYVDLLVGLPFAPNTSNGGKVLLMYGSDRLPNTITEADLQAGLDPLQASACGLPLPSVTGMSLTGVDGARIGAAMEADLVSEQTGYGDLLIGGASAGTGAMLVGFAVGPWGIDEL